MSTNLKPGRKIQDPNDQARARNRANCQKHRAKRSDQLGELEVRSCPEISLTSVHSYFSIARYSKKHRKPLMWYEILLSLSDILLT
jgi:hypothetical protein